MMKYVFHLNEFPFCSFYLKHRDVLEFWNGKRETTGQRLRSFFSVCTASCREEDAGSLGDESSSDEQLPGDADGLEGPTKKHQFNARI